MENNQTSTEINNGSIVKFEGGFYRISRCTKNKVNLASVFGGRIYHKGIAKAEVTEAGAEWYNRWSQSETYMCM
jgi:hypothetical protein